MDYQRRTKNYQDMDINIKLRSYQVKGLTKSFNQYEWEKTRCSDLSRCWGLSERIFEVRQKKNQMQLIHLKIRPNQTNEEVVNRLYLNLKKKESRNEQIYTSIGSCSTMRSFFWPDLFTESLSNPRKTFYYHVSFIPRDPVIGLENLPIVWWPNEMKSPERIYPMTINFSFFEAKQDCKLPFPESYADLEMNYKPSHLTFLDIYEGGGGLRATQYKWIKNDAFDRRDPLPLWTNKRSKIDVDVALYENKFRPRWINPHHLNEDNCYVRGFQDGFAGPITSFWARVHNFNSWYC